MENGDDWKVNTLAKDQNSTRGREETHTMVGDVV